MSDTFYTILSALLPEDIETRLYRGHRTCSLFWPGTLPENLKDDPELADEDFDTYSPSWYLDGTPVDQERPCDACGLTAENKSAPDPCLGMMPGVKFACCGHGMKQNKDTLTAITSEGIIWQGQAYVSLKDDSVLRGDDALAYFREKEVGPPCE